MPLRFSALLKPCHLILQGTAIVLFGVCLSACATNPVTGDTELVFVTEDQELEGLGEKLHPQILKSYGGEYKSPDLNNYVIEVGNRLAEISHRQNLVYRFTVLDVPTVNAFAIPGYIYITRGMLMHLGSEAELAAVLGHEMGHITARHSVRQHTKSTLATILSNFVARGTNNSLFTQLSQLLSVAIIRGYGRKFELEADQLASEYLVKIGYQPEAMLNVLNVLKSHETFEKKLAMDQDREPNIYHGIFSTHPDNDTRLQEIIREAAENKTSAYRDSGQQVYFDRIRGLVYGTSEKQGIVRGNRFYHSDFKITMEFPNQWTIVNNPNSLLAHNRQNTMAISVLVEDKNRKETAQEFAQNRFKGIDMETSKPFGTNVDGWTAVVKSIKTPYGSRKARIGVMMSDYHVFKFLSATKDKKQFDVSDPIFLQVMESIRTLSKDEYKLAQPRTIQIKQIKEGDTFQSLADSADLPSYAEEILRLINGKYPNGELKPGELIKVIH